MTPYSLVALLLLSLYCFIFLAHSLNNGFSVELIHRDSSKSPFYNPDETQFQRATSVVRRSINRANHFNKASISTNIGESTTITSTTNGAYLMSYSLGTPPFKVFGIIDTGSDLIWVQCKPCEVCYNQTSPIFDPSKSKTYGIVPCTSSKCQEDTRTSCSNNDKNTCGYTIYYGDDSRSEGDFSEETLTLESTNGTLIPFPKTMLGCAHHSSTATFQGTKASGVVGLAGGPLSLISQMGSSIGGKFSYCLVPIFLKSNISSKLNFGDAAIVSGKGTVSTPIVKSDIDTFYFITLEAFSVGDKRIEFESSSSGFIQEGNMVIDSGSTLTLLQDDLYTKLESAVKDVVQLKLVDDPSKQLSLCYEITSEQLNIPIITAHFRGADVPLSALNTFVQVSETVTCFAFTSSQSYNIFGNLSQQNLLVGYDLQKMVVSFKPTYCTKQ